MFNLYALWISDKEIYKKRGRLLQKLEKKGHRAPSPFLPTIFRLGTGDNRGAVNNNNCETLVTRAMQGVILRSYETVKKLIDQTSTKTGLKVCSNIIKKVSYSNLLVKCDFLAF
jgi:hypothetical protein